MIIETLTRWLPHRRRTRPISTIVLHATAGSTFTGALSTLRLRGLSYHYIVEDQRERDGRIIKCAPADSIALHAGASMGPQGPNVNNYSVGIALVNRNDGQDPYSDEQHRSVRMLCENLITHYPTIRYVTTHYWVSPGRKSDPRGFDVERLWLELHNRFPGRGLVMYTGGRGVLR